MGFVAGMQPARTRMDPDRERDLVHRARTDAAAFGDLYDFYLPRLYGFVYRRVQERPVAEDLTATTFERALEAIRFRDFRNDAFGAWLYRVAANAVVDHFRAQRRVAPVEEGADLPSGDGGSDAFAAALDREELRQAIARLPDLHRTVLTLRFYDDLDPDEASAVMGCSRGTFAVRLHRAINALRAALGEQTLTEATDAA